jgi:hypothetical protein
VGSELAASSGDGGLEVVVGSLVPCGRCAVGMWRQRSKSSGLVAKDGPSRDRDDGDGAVGNRGKDGEGGLRCESGGCGRDDSKTPWREAGHSSVIWVAVSVSAEMVALRLVAAQ